MNFISIPTKNLPYKKMHGYLKTQKINPTLIAISISDNGQKYVRIDWKNYLPFGHKVVKVILLKIDNLFLFVGYSKDQINIIYNNAFSEIILNQEISPRIDKTIYSTHSKESAVVRIDRILDVVGQFGVSALSNEMLEQLKELSRK